MLGAVLSVLDVGGGADRDGALLGPEAGTTTSGALLVYSSAIAIAAGPVIAVRVLRAAPASGARRSMIACQVADEVRCETEAMRRATTVMRCSGCTRWPPSGPGW